MWMIWSNEHGAWWAPNSAGYTRIFSKAGKYTEEQAKEITKNANLFRHEVNEVAILVGETYEREPSLVGVMP